MFWKCEDGTIESFKLEKDVDKLTEIHIYKDARILYDDDDPHVIFTMSKDGDYNIELSVQIGKNKYVVCEEKYDIRRLISWLIKTYKDLFGK